jgi:hypothetical protein
MPPEPSFNPVGVIGRVTGTVGPNKVGEVSLPFGEGTDTFYAHPYDGKSTFEPQDRVVVMEYAAPKTVYVTKTL